VVEVLAVVEVDHHQTNLVTEEASVPEEDMEVAPRLVEEVTAEALDAMEET